MRTALLQTPGEACTVAYWLRNFETWRDEVDELIVLVNNLYYGDIAKFDQRAIEAAGGKVIFAEGRVQHGDCIDRLVSEAHAKDPNGLVVLVEDDAYVRKPGAVRAAFDRIEAGETDIIGSPRYQDAWDSPVEGSWGPLTKDWSEIGRVLWPTFLFARSADLLATNRRFGYDTWDVGDVIPGLGIEVTPELCAYIGTGAYAALDVFYGTTYQLRAAGHRIEHVNHVRVWTPESTERWVAEDPPWVHATELSTILGAVMPLFPGEDGLPTPEIPDLAAGGGRWTRCVAWWQRLARSNPDLPGHVERYLGWLERFIVKADIDRAELVRWQERIDPWITWAEA
jgi:hypothetical protein